MPTPSYIADSETPLTFEDLTAGFSDAGLTAGSTVIVHSSLSSFGYVIGGPYTVIKALMHVMGMDGTLMMPAHTADNSDPSNWENPPVPEAWWGALREKLPAYDPARTQSYGMGAIAELFRTWPGVRRSAHPVGSFVAYGPDADDLLVDHDHLDNWFGEGTPIEKLYRLDASVMLIGVDHSRNTALHLAEHRAAYPNKREKHDSAAVFVAGKRHWLDYSVLDYDSDDFAEIGAAYEAEYDLQPHFVGKAAIRITRVRPLVDFAVAWMEQHRGG